MQRRARAFRGSVPTCRLCGHKGHRPNKCPQPQPAACVASLYDKCRYGDRCARRHVQPSEGERHVPHLDDTEPGAAKLALDFYCVVCDQLLVEGKNVFRVNGGALWTHAVSGTDEDPYCLVNQAKQDRMCYQINCGGCHTLVGWRYPKTRHGVGQLWKCMYVDRALGANRMYCRSSVDDARQDGSHQKQSKMEANVVKGTAAKATPSGAPPADGSFSLLMQKIEALNVLNTEIWSRLEPYTLASWVSCGSCGAKCASETHCSHCGYGFSLMSFGARHRGTPSQFPTPSQFSYQVVTGVTFLGYSDVAYGGAALKPPWYRHGESRFCQGKRHHRILQCLVDVKSRPLLDFRKCFPKDMNFFNDDLPKHAYFDLSSIIAKYGLLRADAVHILEKWKHSLEEVQVLLGQMEQAIMDDLEQTTALKKLLRLPDDNPEAYSKWAPVSETPDSCFALSWDLRGAQATREVVQPLYDLVRANYRRVK